MQDTNKERKKENIDGVRENVKIISSISCFFIS
jgi:hypothetical protein